MKKLLAAMLLFCMMLTGIPATVNAAECSNNETNQMEMLELTNDEGIVPYNRDVWSTNGILYVSEKGITITVRPGAGENLKVHFALSKLFLTNMRLRIYLGDKLIANWNTEGDHWADVVTNTGSAGYKIRLVGPAYISGAFYTEP